MAGIVATVFMFAMLFTVGASYFMFVNQNNLLYSQAAAARASTLSGQHGESLTLSAALSPTNVITFDTQNLGAATVEITGILVSDSTGSVLAFCQAGTPAPCPTLPYSVNQGMTSSQVPTGVTYSTADTYTISVVTQLGSVFSTTYPPTAESLAAQALSSGAIGDLYIQFHTFHWYTVSGNTLTDRGLGFSISCTTLGSSDIAFSISMTNLNSNKLNITLDQYTLMDSFFPPKSTGGGNNPTLAYYVVSNVSNTISTNYSPLVLDYNQPKTVVFASGNPDGSLSFSPQGTNFCSYKPAITFSFVVSHGCQGVSLVKCNTVSNDNYGQVAPYVSSLFY